MPVGSGFDTGKPLKYEQPGRSYIFGVRPLYVFLIGLAGLKSYIHILLAVYFNGFPVSGPTSTHRRFLSLM